MTHKHDTLFQKNAPDAIARIHQFRSVIWMLKQTKGNNVESREKMRTQKYKHFSTILGRRISVLA
jgi:hypothetical protein